MTVLVGVLCGDGVVIGSDSSLTFAAGRFPTIEQKGKKIEIIENSVLVAGTGQVGLGQRFCSIVKDAWDKKIFSQSKNIEVGRYLSQKAVEDFASTKCDRGQYGALLAYASGGKHYLCEFQVNDFQPEWKNIDNCFFVSIGCGQPITDPFLGFMRRIFWKSETPKIADAIFIVTWALNQAIELNTGGINGPLQIAVLRRKVQKDEPIASLISDDEILEHMNNVKGAEEYLEKYKDLLQGKTEETIPNV